MKLEYKGYEYRLILNLNAMEEIQNEVGSFSEWCDEVGKPEPNLKYLLIGLTAMINEAADIDSEEKGKEIPKLTRKQVGRILTDYSVSKLAGIIRTELVKSVSGDESKNG